VNNGIDHWKANWDRKTHG